MTRAVRSTSLLLDRRMRGRPRLLLLFLILLMLATAAGIVYSVAQFRAGERLNTAQSQDILAAFARALDAWLPAACTRATAQLQTSGVARAIISIADDGAPVLPPCTFALQACTTSSLARLVENYFPKTVWSNVPVAALTNDAAGQVVTDPVLARLVRHDRAVAVEIAWRVAEAAQAAGDTNRAKAVYCLMQECYPHDMDAHGFPIRLAAWLEELALQRHTPWFDSAAAQWLDAAGALDLRTAPVARDATLALVQRLARLGANPSLVQRTRVMLAAFLPQTGLCVRVTGRDAGRATTTSYWLDEDRCAAWIADEWLSVAAARASNSFVHIVVRRPFEPAALGECAATNLYGVTLALVPFDAARWAARYRVRMLAQIGGLSGLFVLLAWLTIRAARLLRAERLLLAHQLNFVAAVSHELRTPIAAVRALAETIERGVVHEPDDQHEYAKLIMSESDRLTQLVNNILDVARAPGAGRALALQSVALDKAVTAAVATVNLAAAQKGIAITMRTEATPVVNGNVQALERIAYNLLDNAVKYSGAAREVVVTIAADATHARVTVQDFGIGIAPDEHARIFQRFYRVGDELTREYPGVGLGLAIVRELVDALGGSVSVESAPGKGSAFTVTMPIRIRGM
ncbi:MAG: HAMP domain-containing sensor histidine kinase [bacterium]|nr:HAMP domain-containing sensor histidine kinase [bacterium]